MMVAMIKALFNTITIENEVLSANLSKAQSFSYRSHDINQVNSTKLIFCFSSPQTKPYISSRNKHSKYTPLSIFFFPFQVCDVVDRVLKSPHAEILKELNPVCKTQDLLLRLECNCLS